MSGNVSSYFRITRVIHKGKGEVVHVLH